MAQYHPVLAITAGEPAGIGPDLCLQLAQQAHQHSLVVLADKFLLQQRARQLGLSVELVDYRHEMMRSLAAGQLCVLHMPLLQPARAGQLDPAKAARPHAADTE